MEVTYQSYLWNDSVAPESSKGRTRTSGFGNEAEAETVNNKIAKEWFLVKLRSNPPAWAPSLVFSGNVELQSASLQISSTSTIGTYLSTHRL